MLQKSPPSTEARVPVRGRGRRLWFGLAVFAAAAATGWAMWHAGRRPGPTAELAPAFQYDLAALQQIDPARVGYRKIGEIASGFQEARGLALAADGSIWVAGDQALRRFSLAGARLQEIALTVSPRAMAVSADGKVYVAAGGTGVTVDPATGVEWPCFKLPPPATITGMAALPEGLLLADAGSRAVLVCDFNGTVRRRIGGADPATGRVGLVAPSPYLDVVAVGEGRLAVNNPGRHQIEYFSVDGDFIESWGHAAMRLEGFSGCCNPVALAQLRDGRMVTAEKGLARVKRHRRDGAVDCAVATSAEFSGDGFAIDLAVDSADRIYVLDSGSGRVRIYAAKETQP